MPRGVVLLIVLLLGWLVIDGGRRLLPCREQPPAAVVSAVTTPAVPVYLGNGFPSPGIHQFSDGMAVASVMDLAQTPRAAELRLSADVEGRLQPGERLDLEVTDGQVSRVYRRLLPLPQRLLLGVAPHPDRMSRRDWEALPGVGAKLAAAILNDRQKNGDFGSWQGVLRVKGVGPGRLRQWREYFSASDTPWQVTDSAPESFDGGR